MKTRSPIEQMIDAVVRCTKCGKPPGCDCWNCKKCGTPSHNCACKIQLLCVLCEDFCWVERLKGDPKEGPVRTWCPACNKKQEAAKKSVKKTVKKR